jgi:hypothetical protein
MTAYLDYNVFVTLEDGRLTVKEIAEQVNPSIDRFPYSAAHIQEVDNISAGSEQERGEFIMKRLETIRRITKSLYLYQDMTTNAIEWLTEDPKGVLQTIRQVPFAKLSFHSFANLISYRQKEQVRQSLGIEIGKFNNYPPDEVVQHLNSKLVNWGTGDNLIQLLERAVSLHPQGSTLRLHNRIAGLLELIDFLGYWKDRDTESSNVARLWDANHTFFASKCEYFISDDRRLRNKAKVAYSIYGISTRVISSGGD